MKRLKYMALAMLMMGAALLGVAQAQETEYFVAYGEVDHAVLSKPENAGLFSQHIAHLNKLYADGHLAMAGPFDAGDSGLIIVKAASLDEAKALLMADPSIAGGLIKPVWLHGFHAFFNRIENRTMSVEQFNAMMAEGEKMDHGSAGGGDHSAGSSGGEEAGSMDMVMGGVSFLQIPTTDAAASGAFYSSVFGWEIMPQEVGGGTMHFFNAPGGMMGEFSTMTKPAAAMTGVTFFINTESVSAMVPRVTAAGGMVYQEPMALPEGWGHIAIIGDPSGNAVGIWSATP